ncbi:GNAT family N-acetyltransferase [Mycetocola sp.]|jgi:predicted GNAT family acetyltransferase|uniref:GNAT family N-acetyltransferase n=1 Tax=Mycetocola sp. TaxID=1871042 RepID=UPI00261FC072|nr:GNAT family N-acetyltransferase [Mycetocola sp.]MCU1560102.1 family N-acetyltransferase [Mycetocola sp.]
MAPEFAHEPDAHRYTLRLGDELVCVAGYTVRPGEMYFTHTYTSPSRRGNGFAASLIEFAVNDVAATTDLRIVPTCSFVADWFEQHPDRTELLRRAAAV